jgi:hypothetical protein
MHRNNIEKVKDEMRKLEDEHQEAIRQLSEEDGQQILSMKKMLERLKSECESLMTDDGKPKPKPVCTCETTDKDKCPIHNKPQPLPAVQPEVVVVVTKTEEDALEDTPALAPATPSQTPDAPLTATTGIGMGMGRRPNWKPVTKVAMPASRPTMEKELAQLEQLYATMTSVVKDGKNKMTEEQSGRVIQLQRDIVKAREIIAQQQKALTEMQDHQARGEYEVAVALADQQAKLQDQAALIVSLKQRYNVQRDRLVELRDAREQLLSRSEQLETAVRQKDVVIEDLRQQLMFVKKQLEIAEGQTRLAASRSMLHATIATEQVRQQTTTDIGAARLLGRQNSLADLVRNGAKVSVGKLKQLEEAVYSFSEQDLDEEGKRRRQQALEMFEKDRDFRQQRVAMAFEKLREKMRMKELSERMAKMRPDDRVAQAIERMSERHQASMREWDRRKQQLLEERRRHLALVMQAFSDFAVYKAVPAGLQLQQPELPLPR